MSKVFIEENTLTAIGDAIRGKTGGTELLTLDGMATEISNLEIGQSGIVISPERLVFSGDCTYLFRDGKWDWFINDYKNQISTSSMSNASYMFYNTKVTELPFVINMVENIAVLSYICGGAKQITIAPHITLNLTESITNTPSLLQQVNLSSMFNNCNMLRDVEYVFDNENLTLLSNIVLTSASYYHRFNGIFSSCYSLRKIPSWFKMLNISPLSNVAMTTNATPYYQTFQNCYNLDEITELQVVRGTGSETNHMFYNSFNNCYRLKELTFETDNGVPFIVKWKSQTIDLVGSYVGYSSSDINYILNYNSGIAEDKQVANATTYQALKNDPDWFTTNVSYSRYNHDSAVATINSLPDTSAYLATAGGTNTIKFKGTSGSSTDGGAINTLTPEEIAVATAKGWTVTLV